MDDAFGDDASPATNSSAPSRVVKLSVGASVGAIYERLHLRKSSPLSRLQREMVAVVVNRHVNGAP